MTNHYIFAAAPTVSVPIQGLKERFPVRRVYCVGQNYADHTKEMGGNPKVEDPFFFSKPFDALVLSDVDKVPYPPLTQDLHHEVELVVAIGKSGHDIKIEEATDHVYGYAVGVDLTRRDVQGIAKSKGRPWDLAKGFDHSAPIADIVPVDQLAGHLTQGFIRLSVNGAIRQDGDLSNMILNVSKIISHLSKEIKLVAGDLIYTGTPAGVSALQRGDEVKAEISGLGARIFKIV